MTGAAALPRSDNGRSMSFFPDTSQLDFACRNNVNVNMVCSSLSLKKLESYRVIAKMVAAANALANVVVIVRTAG